MANLFLILIELCSTKVECIQLKLRNFFERRL
jgi:hypothetical protein